MMLQVLQEQLSKHLIVTENSRNVIPRIVPY